MKFSRGAFLFYDVESSGSATTVVSKFDVMVLPQLREDFIVAALY
jgi:hypothetical protein